MDRVDRRQRWEVRAASFIGHEVAGPLRWWRHWQQGRLLDMVLLALAFSVTAVAVFMLTPVVFGLLVIAVAREAFGW